MGYMVDGQWVKGELVTADKKGRFVRSESIFRLKGDLTHFRPEVDLASTWSGHYTHKRYVMRV